ncbi:uncharacterized protein LOC127725474 [Mytilus californianus]|uniref:uncharacterized protein LOC127725474 n=1 Tax=Mytilus californianus TaxID=6549 RepID=UPI0022458E7C|nr:uncharacterized protein LOC127725474 [Mytilus californianus]
MLKYFIGLYFVCIFISSISAEHAEITLAETESKNRGERDARNVYTSQEGGNVIIKCGVNLSERQVDEVYSIQWKSQKYTNIIEQFNKSHADINKYFTGRVELVNGSSLKISRLLRSDAAQYICTVKFNRYKVRYGRWIRLVVNKSPQPTIKPDSIKSRTGPSFTATLATPVSITTNTVRDVDGDDGGNGHGYNTESDGSREVKVNTDLSVDESKGTSSINNVTEPRTTGVLDVESQSVKVLTEITTVESTYDKIQNLSNETSVDKKVQSVTRVGFEQDLPTNDIRSETLTSELKENLHTGMTIITDSTTDQPASKKSLIYNVQGSTFKTKLDVETTTGTVPKHITTIKVDVSSDSASPGYDENKFTTDRSQNESDVPESNTYRVSLSTAPMMSHSNTKSLTEAVIKTTNQSEQEHKTLTETKTEKTTISRNGTSSQSVDLTRTRISIETTPESVIITESADKSETNPLGMGELTTAPSVKVSMTTISEKDSYLTSTTLQQLQTSTESGSYFNVTITDRNPKAIKLQVIVYSTKDEEFTKVEFTFRTEDHSTTRSFDVSGHKINETFRINKLEIGICYKFQIHVITQNGRSIGPNEQMACTTPKRPDSSTDVVKTTSTSIYLLIKHPSEGHFDSFRLDYKNNTRPLSMKVNKSLDVTQTETEISGLVPESCYNISVYTVSFSEISKYPRTFSNVCTQTQLDPYYYTVIYGESSFTISWVNFSDKYNVNVSCNSWTKMFFLKAPLLSVNKTVPGDCCVLNVKNWNDTVSRQYFVHVNETLPEYPVVISTVTAKTRLNLTWREPIRSNGWIYDYTVHLFDRSNVTAIDNFNISCIQPEPKCSGNDSDWKYQCSNFSLVNNRNANVYYNNSQFYLSIGGLKPSMVYHYSITAMNKAGSNTTDRVPVITKADKPESPASLDVTVLNVTTMNITWSPPNVTNGVITRYSVSYCSNGTSGCKYTVVDGMTSVILTELDCWKEYHVCVSAQTLAGFGPKKCGVNNTNVYEPQAQISKITASNTTIRLEFQVPCDNVEAPISYNIPYTSLDHSCTVNQTNVTEWWECFPLHPCEISGLFSYWDYFIKVQESVEDNVGVWSKEHKVTTLHSVPEEVQNVRVGNIESDSLTVCWEQPCFLNSDTVFYNVTLDEDTPYVNIYRSGAIPLTECEKIADLLPYTNYTLSVTASNQYGNSDPVIIMKQTDIAVPNQPNFGRVLEQTTMLTVEWKPPYPYPGPTNYTVKVRDREKSETKDCQTSVYHQTRCSVYGLEEYWQYEVTIIAHTDRGNKQYKHPHYIRTKQSAPGPVTRLRVNHEKDPEKPRQVFITFGPPVYRERNGVIKAYYVRCHDTRTYRDIQVVKLNKNLNELKIIVPDQVLLNISVFAETVENGTEVYQTVIVPAGAKDFPTTEALAGVSLAFIVFIIAAIVVVILYRRHMVCFKPQFELKEKELVQLKVVKQNKKISVDHEDTRKSRPVKIDKFYQHVEILARDSNHFFSKEYKELKAMAPMLSTEAAEQQEARTKNRYSNILPFDHSRVKLLPLDDEEGSDYINANYIPGFNSKREYIATQGPLPSTKDDFWRMIWEQNVSVIVMLTQCIERGKRKCECYWPECVKEPVYYGDLSIEIENESHLPEYVLRTINVTFGNIQKRIMHFLYIAWPDMGVPSSTDNMISLVKTVRSHVNPTMKGPITVHCSAGVGRTGTFINVDILLHQLDNDYNQIDVFGDVLKLRNHRCNMVQTEDQYVFIHHCISDYILAMSEDTDEEEVVDGGDEPMYQNVPSKR